MPITPPLNLLADFYHFFSQRLEKSQVLLDNFVRLLPNLYGQQECTFNSHSLLHFPSQVLDHGSLSFTSAKFRYFCEIPRNSPKKREIPRNPPEIFPNTCRQNIFNTYRGCYICFIHPKRLNLSWNLVTTTSKQRLKTTSRFFCEFWHFSRENPAKLADFSANFPLKIPRNFAFFPQNIRSPVYIVHIMLIEIIKESIYTITFC